MTTSTMVEQPRREQDTTMFVKPSNNTGGMYSELHSYFMPVLCHHKYAAAADMSVLLVTLAFYLKLRIRKQ
jgi:hypothetical protein